VIEQLFGSKTRVKLLQLFYSNPNRSFYVREITRKIDEQINSVRRELANLLNVGIISSNTNNNRLYYEVMQDYEYYEAFTQIFGGAKIAAKPKHSEDTQSAIKSLGNVEKIIFTGQFTRDEKSGIDVLIVGDVNPTQVSKYIEGIESTENKELRYATMDSKEYKYRKEVNDRFLSLVLSSKKQVVFEKKSKTKNNKKDKKEK
jgi:hypothetical protein